MLFDTEGRPPPAGYAAGGGRFRHIPTGAVGASSLLLPARGTHMTVQATITRPFEAQTARIVASCPDEGTRLEDYDDPEARQAQRIG
jgi:hypothetical protein